MTVTVVPAAMTRGEGRKAKFRMARRADFGCVVVVVVVVVARVFRPPTRSGGGPVGAPIG